MKIHYFLKGASQCAAFSLILMTAGCDGESTKENPVFEKAGTFLKDKSNPQREVEVCFVLDTTGSMSGLIDGAKKKIWSIANEIVTANPGAKVSMGLIAYRDRGDEYITQRFALSQDLDSLYENLLKFQAEGGGDTPESVNQALAEAVDLMRWSKSPKVLKTIFLVGDAPPHLDYEDDVPFEVTCRKAAEKGVVINTVQCGQMAETVAIWRRIAGSSDGKYVALQQDGNMQTVDTPLDEKLAELNRKIGKTLVPYGSADQKQSVTAKQSRAEAAPASVAATRLSYNSNTGKTVQGQGDLLDDLKDKKVELKSLPKEELPTEWQGKNENEIKEKLEKMRQDRAALQQEIVKVSKDREAWLADYKKKEEAAGKKADSFDAEVNGMMVDQSKKVFKE